MVWQSMKSWMFSAIRPQTLPGWALAATMVLALGGAGLVQAKGPLNNAALPTIELKQLPAQGRDVMVLIAQGGPFKYDKDGTVFGNRERILPPEKRGFYREYTVKTPGERSRGARRIVCGGLQPTTPDACFYTDDHYSSFRKIAR
jgi:ribonuclease T1